MRSGARGPVGWGRRLDADRAAPVADRVPFRRRSAVPSRRAARETGSAPVAELSRAVTVSVRFRSVPAAVPFPFRFRLPRVPVSVSARFRAVPRFRSRSVTSRFRGRPGPFRYRFRGLPSRSRSRARSAAVTVPFRLRFHRSRDLRLGQEPISVDHGTRSSRCRVQSMTPRRLLTTRGCSPRRQGLRSVSRRTRCGVARAGQDHRAVRSSRGGAVGRRDHGRRAGPAPAAPSRGERKASEMICDRRRDRGSRHPSPKLCPDVRRLHKIKLDADFRCRPGGLMQARRRCKKTCSALQGESSGRRSRPRRRRHGDGDRDGRFESCR